MASTTVGALNVTVGANIRGLTKGLGKASARIRKFGGSVANVSKRLAKFGTLAGGAAAAGVAFFVKQQADMVTRTQRVADRLGIATKELSRFQYAARVTGTDVDRLQEGIQEMQLRLEEAAATGSGPAAEAMEKLGLDAQRLQQMDPASAFRRISEAIKNSPDMSNFAIDAIFGGSDGRELTNMIMQGAAGLDRMSKTADKVGASFSAMDASQVEVARRSVFRLQQVLLAAARTLAVQLSPFITAAANKLVDFSQRGGSMGEQLTRAIESVTKSIGVMIDKIDEARVSAGKAAASAGTLMGTIAEGAVDAQKKIFEMVSSTALFSDVRLSPMGEAVKQWSQDMKGGADILEEFTKKIGSSGSRAQQISNLFDSIRADANKAAESLQKMGAPEPGKVKDFATEMGKQAGEQFMAEASKTGAEIAKRQAEEQKLLRGGSAQAQAFMAQRSRRSEGKSLERIQRSMLDQLRKQTDWTAQVAESLRGGQQPTTVSF